MFDYMVRGIRFSGSKEFKRISGCLEMAEVQKLRWEKTEDFKSIEIFSFAQFMQL